MLNLNDNQSHLKIVSFTWNRDSHGLFDYESSQTKLNNIIISKNCQLIRHQDHIKEAPENTKLYMQEQFLANIQVENSNSF
jgi:hypothetical protein